MAWVVMEALHKTPLHDIHVALGARMVDFAGWMLPIQYRGVTEEHHHTRTACSVFDVSHMGRLALIGRDGGSLLNHVCTRNLADAEVHRSYYSHICNDNGGILDDVIVSRFEDRWGVVCNGVNRERIVTWMQAHAKGRDVEIRDDTLATAMVACQGPRTMEIAREMAGEDLTTLKRYHLTVRMLGPVRVVVYRSGYTGEDGVELVLPASLVHVLAPKLYGTANRPHPVIRPAGLAARDTLRIEAAMPLYGHELNEEVDSLSAGQGWCVDLTKDFIGAEALRRLRDQGLPRKLVGLELEGRRIARQHFGVYASGRKVGAITSGTLSPTLGKSIAMALVEAGQAGESTALDVELGPSKRVPAKIVKLPFYRRANDA